MTGHRTSHDESSSETDALIPKKEKAGEAITDNITNDSSVSTSLRWTTNILALSAAFFFSGIIFGWAPLELMLYREGQYSNYCEINNGTDDGRGLETLEKLSAVGGKTIITPLCSQQTNALAGMFTTGQFFLNFCSVFVGIALDSLPKSTLLMMTGVIQIAGMCLLALSDTTMSNDDEDINRDYFYVAYSLLAIGGCATMLSAYPATFLLKQYQAGLLACVSCLFDASSIIFSFAKSLQDHYGISRRDMFLLYTIWAVIIYVPLIICWTVLERKNWEKVVEDENDAIYKKQEQQQQQQQKDTSTSITNSEDSVQDELHSNAHYMAHIRRIQKMDIVRQLKTTDFAFAMLFVATHMLQCNYHIMSVDAYLLSLGDDDSKYATIFSWALPCGIFFVPFIEQTVTYLGIVNTLHTTNIAALLFGIILFIPYLPLQVVNFFIFTGFRAYLYATLNNLVASTFGVSTMGRIIGVVFTFAAVVGLVQYPMAVASEVYFDGDYTPMNILLLVIAVIPTVVTFQYGRYVMYSSQENDQDGDDVHKNNNDIVKRGSHMSPALLLSSPGREMVHEIRRARKMKNEDA